MGLLYREYCTSDDQIREVTGHSSTESANAGPASSVEHTLTANLF